MWVPSLDFDSEMSFGSAPAAGRILTAPPISYNTGYNPFNGGSPQPPESGLHKVNKQHWEKLFDGFKTHSDAGAEQEQQEIETLKKESIDFRVFQLNNKYLVTTYNQNVMIVDQQRAHERIVYEHYMNSLDDKPVSSQQLLFPEQIELSANDFMMVKDMIEEFRQLGFDLEVFGKNSIVVNGTPTDMQDFNVVQTIEGIIETFKLNTIDAKVEKRDNLCRAIAKNISIKYGKVLESDEMKLLLNGLFQCENPLYTASGKVVMMEVEYSEIERFFKR
jgi:DNA mismatch repair protein MutL